MGFSCASRNIQFKTHELDEPNTDSRNEANVRHEKRALPLLTSSRCRKKTVPQAARRVRWVQFAEDECERCTSACLRGRGP